MRNPEKLTTLAVTREISRTSWRRFCQARAMRIDRLGDLGGAPARAARRRSRHRQARFAAAGRADRRMVRCAGGDRAQPVGATGGPSTTHSRSARARLAPAGIRERWAAAGSATCPTRTPAPTGGPPGSPRPPAAGPTACCAATVTRSGGMRACPGRRCRTGWPARWQAPATYRHARRTRDCRIDWDAPDREAHRDGVLACLEAIRAGEIYQACVCTQFTGTVTGAPLDFFIAGVARTSPARAAYVAGRWGAVASLSPELFLRRRGNVVTSSPIKGTLPLDAWPSALRASAKEVAENIMIVDLVRNDLGRVAITGTVTVPELLVVRRAPGRVAPGVHGVGAGSARSCRRRPCWTPPSRRPRSPEHPNSVPAN